MTHWDDDGPAENERDLAQRENYSYSVALLETVPHLNKGYSQILFAPVSPGNRVQSQISSETISRVGERAIRSRRHDKSNGYGNLVR